MINLTFGGVPEHFNLPWHQAMENGSFSDAGINMNWHTFAGGTGAMTKALRNGSVDGVVVLTEGITADIAKGNPSKIIQTYIESPLIWGIHCSSFSSIEKEEDLPGKTFAISRYGSGSHLMAYVYADQKEWSTKDLKFDVVGNIDGAREAMRFGDADILFWEKYTTKPYVDSGELKRVGQIKTPWPCFMVAVRNEVLENEPEAIKKVSEIILKQSETFINDPNTVKNVAKKFGLLEEDAKAWYSKTEWAKNNEVSEAMIDSVYKTLEKLELVKGNHAINTFIHKF